jgi:hypothetical protein
MLLLIALLRATKDILERVINADSLYSAGLIAPNTHKTTNKTDTRYSGTQGLMHERLNQTIHRFKEAFAKKKR